MSARSSDMAMSSGTEHSCTQPHLLYGDWFLRMRIPREPMRRCTTLNAPVLEVSVTSTIVSSANKVKDREYWCVAVHGVAESDMNKCLNNKNK